MKTQPLSQSLKAEKWGFRLRRVSTQCLTVKFSGSQMKTAKCEGWQWPDIAQGHPHWLSALGNVAGLEGSADPGKAGGAGGHAGGDRPAGLSCPQPHCVGSWQWRLPALARPAAPWTWLLGEDTAGLSSSTTIPIAVPLAGLSLSPEEQGCFPDPS